MLRFVENCAIFRSFLVQELIEDKRGIVLKVILRELILLATNVHKFILRQKREEETVKKCRLSRPTSSGNVDMTIHGNFRIQESCAIKKDAALEASPGVRLNVLGALVFREPFPKKHKL